MVGNYSVSTSIYAFSGGILKVNPGASNATCYKTLANGSGTLNFSIYVTGYFI
jgi:hypothetical protein